MKIAYRAGHNPQAPGAVGILNEIVVNREVLPHFGAYLMSLGYEALDVTPPKGMSKSDDLAYGVNKANAWGADLFISLHVNKAYEKYIGAIGSEVCAHNSNNSYAINVAKALYDLGFTDDEGKQRRKSTNGLNINPSLYELKHTKMPAMIVEMFFLEATKDVELYKKIGPQIIAKVIAEGIEGKKVQSAPAPDPAPKPSVIYEAHVQDIGWQGKRKNGETAGTTGQSKRLEALTIKLENTSAKLEMQGHIEGKGWTSIRTDGEVVGTMGESLRLEAIAIKGIGVTVTYRVHVQDIGWTNWVRDREVAGTTGQGRRIEAIEIKLV
ncbi:hydrophobic W protein [Clostridium amylolyticum]|uniref:Hydrophobic W protein n=1 Tax=Clostridium amylolyticum TaxID=1121298 RepID=A0A1M6EW62_9CLOT|nr:N-acetylmuramoyl-L-alanine amidase [Clostridium amylolyticum]SHI89666.1 hydrophobic W protein [Clostridium amylolyticum]